MLLSIYNFRAYYSYLFLVLFLCIVCFCIVFFVVVDLVLDVVDVVSSWVVAVVVGWVVAVNCDVGWVELYSKISKSLLSLPGDLFLFVTFFLVVFGIGFSHSGSVSDKIFSTWYSRAILYIYSAILMYIVQFWSI